MRVNDDSEPKMRAMRLLEKDDATPTMYISDIARLFECTVSSAAERKGMSRGYRKILFHLAHKDGVTQLELVKLSHLTAPTVSVALSKMESDGLVKREADKNDMRQIRVYLTEKGRAHDDFIRRVSRETEEQILKGLTDDDITELNRMLRVMLENMVGKE